MPTYDNVGNSLRTLLKFFEATLDEAK
jgi:hypothetical protein